MLEPQITLTGNVGSAPKLRVLPSGASVANFRLACTPRRQDRASGEWSDGATLWFGVTCWKTMAENAVQSLRTGDRVVVTGRLALHTWSGDDGAERTSHEIEASSLGVDLSRTKVVVERVPRADAADDVWSSTGRTDVDGRAELTRRAEGGLPQEPDQEAA